MDSVFQSLLLGGGNVSGDKNKSVAATTSASTGPGGGASRYATFIPREAMKPTNNNSALVMQQQEKVEANNQQEEKEESIAVYKLVNGELTLLDEDEYDVVSVNNSEGAAKNNEEGKTNDDTKDEDGMDIDSTETDVDHDEPTLYIVRSNRHPNGGDDIKFSSASVSSQTAAVMGNNNDDCNNTEENVKEIAAIKEASHTASTLSRALAQRTDGFDELRPKYYDFMNTDNNNNDVNGKNTNEQQQQGQNKKGDKKSKLTTASSSSTAAQSSSAKGGGDKSKTADGGKATTSNNAAAAAAAKSVSSTLQQRQQQYSQTQKLIASLNNHTTSSSSSNIRDGDTPKTILQLTQMRMWQERNIDPSMQGMELDDWEDEIDWEGGCDDDDNDESNNSDEGKKANDNDSSYKAPVPEGGYPKRPRRMLPPQYENPVELLYEPRNPRLEALDLISSVDWEGATSDTNGDDDDDDDSVNVPLILQSSIAGKSVASLLAPCPTSRPLPFELHPSYQQRYDREMTSEITSTADIGNKRHEALEKYKEQRQRKREQMAKDKQNRVTEVMSALSLSGTGRRITSSLMGPGGAERTGRPSRHALGSSSAHDAEYVEQLELVYNHTLVKPDLTLSEYRQFHRPRLPLAVVNPTCPWQFQTRVITENKRSSRGATAADGSTIVGSYHSMMSAGAKAQHKIRNEADLSPSMGDLVVMEYCEERPPLFMTKGHTCRIVNYYRGDRAHCPVSAGGGDRPLRKRHGDKAASAKGPTPDGPSNRAERPPRLVGPNQYNMKSAADLIGIMPKKKKSADAASKEAKKETSINVLPEGVTEILHQKVHGPFIGEVEEGKTQTGLISNLFAAAMFRHDSEPTDFLMILGQMREASTIISGSSAPTNASGGLGVILRALPANIYTVAQTEPRLKVFSPNTNDEKKFVNAMFSFQVAKNIERKEIRDGEGLTFDDIKDRLFANTNVPINQLRKHVKQVANFDRANKGIWSVKSIGEDDFPGVEGLGRKVSPEGVAAYESQCAAIHRLKDLGITELYTGTNMVANVAMVQTYLNGAAQAAMERRREMKRVLEVTKRDPKKSSDLIYYEKAFEKLDADYKKVKRRQEIARFIYEELQLSPWYLSGEFIDIHKRGIGTARMRLTGLGDPSGVGEAYNFIRETDTKSTQTRNTDGALNAQIKKITGTENDLRKLTMKQMASLLRSYGMKDKQISVLKRWDRVHVIRDLSTKAASDGMGDELGERFARGEKLRLSDQRENYKQRIQEIWRRQLAALGSDTLPSDQAAKVTKNLNNADAKEAEKETADASSDEEDAEFEAMLENDMDNTGTANRLVAEVGGASGMRSMGQEALNQDARELADLQRQLQEERLINEGLGQADSGGDSKAKKKFKVIRRKITKTNPDGTQVVTFEFIVNKEKVESIIEKKKFKEENEKPQKKKKKKTDGDEDVDESRCIGHAMFEDEDNVRSRGRRSIKLSMKKETVTNRKGTGPKKASHNKLSSTVKHKRDLVRQKRLKEKEEAEMYKSHVSGKGTSARKKRGSVRDRMPHVILSDRFETIRNKVELRPNAGPFFKPVPRAAFPNYYEVIAWPIDLSTIREKNQKYEYKTADSFLAEFDLMRKNAIKFNGEQSPISAEAKEIYESVKSTIDQNRDEFNQMEQAVVDQLAGKKKTSKKKGASASTATSSSAGTMTANVVLDGVQTQVNLGQNLTFGFGSDSDDSD
eukprot:scaffold2651_cov137-Skeletonema_dohrnii-CCMP3373.AAC.1